MPAATIIGAGPAGSSAAVILRRLGWEVTLIEQHPFPRDKVCGECLSAVGMDVLQRLQLAEVILRAGAVRLTGALLHSPHGRTIRLSLPRPMWGLSRRILDQSLLDAARDAGTRLLQPARCEAITQNPLTLRIRHLPDNRMETLYPTHLLLADGKGSLAPNAPHPVPTGDFGVKTHFTGVDGPRDAIELFAVKGHYGGLAPIEAGRWNFAFSVPARRLRDHHGDLDALLHTLRRENPILRRRLRHAVQATGWLTSPLPRFPVAQHWPTGIFPLGNAAAAIEPIGGEGMGLALQSAELAGHMLDRADRNHNPADPNRLRRQFVRLWRRRRLACRVGAIVFSSPRLSELMIQTAAASPAAARVFLSWIGKNESRA